MKIDHNSSKPLHMQAEEILRKLIELDEYKNGKLFPNEVELSAQLQISRNTLRQAINKLVFEGLLVRKKGYGTKVVKKGIVGGIKNWLSFSQEMKMLGISIRNFELHMSLKQPTEEIRAFFNLKYKDVSGSLNPSSSAGPSNSTESVDLQDSSQEPISPTDMGLRCVVLERVRGKKEYPFVYFISYFNPTIPITGEEDFTRPLYEMLESKYQIIVKTSKEEISARLAGEFIADKLEIKASDAILIRKRFVYDVNGIPVEYNIGYYRADSFTYTIDAER